MGGKIGGKMVRTSLRLGKNRHIPAMAVANTLETLVERSQEKVAGWDIRLISVERFVVVTVAFSVTEAVSSD